jgi:hypothetical protein
MTQSPVGGDEGEGDQKVFIQSTPTLSVPHQRGRGIGREISNIFGWNLVNALMVRYSSRCLSTKA